MKQNSVQAYPTPAYTIYQTSAYPAPTLHSHAHTAGYIDLLTLYLPQSHPDLPVHLAAEIKAAYPAPRPPKSPKSELPTR